MHEFALITCLYAFLPIFVIFFNHMFDTYFGHVCFSQKYAGVCWNTLVCQPGASIYDTCVGLPLPGTFVLSDFKRVHIAMLCPRQGVRCI